MVRFIVSVTLLLFGVAVVQGQGDDCDSNTDPTGRPSLGIPDGCGGPINVSTPGNSPVPSGLTAWVAESGFCFEGTGGDTNGDGIIGGTIWWGGESDVRFFYDLNEFVDDGSPFGGGGNLASGTASPDRVENAHVDFAWNAGVLGLDGNGTRLRVYLLARDTCSNAIVSEAWLEWDANLSDDGSDSPEGGVAPPPGDVPDGDSEPDDEPGGEGCCQATIDRLDEISINGTDIFNRLNDLVDLAEIRNDTLDTISEILEEFTDGGGEYEGEEIGFEPVSPGEIGPIPFAASLPFFLPLEAGEVSSGEAEPPRFEMWLPDIRSSIYAPAYVSAGFFGYGPIDGLGGIGPQLDQIRIVLREILSGTFVVWTVWISWRFIT